MARARVSGEIYMETWIILKSATFPAVAANGDSIVSCQAQDLRLGITKYIHGLI